MKSKFWLWAALLCLLCSFKSDQRKITIFMIGDSTMANKNLVGGNPERGWGQMLPGFLSDDIRVDNHAVNGRSTKSFIEEGRWEKVRTQIRKGDYVFIQFGHNDEKVDPKRHTVAGGSFDDNLRKFVNETREQGGIPILFNSIVRRNFVTKSDYHTLQAAVQQDDVRRDAHPDARYEARSESVHPEEGIQLVDTHGAYLESPRRVAEELDVPFVDMNKLTHELVEGMGPQASKTLFMWIAPNTIPFLPKGREDNTHLNIHGARVITKLTVDLLAKVVPALAPYVRHYDFVVAKDGSGDFFTVQEAINAVPDFRKNVRTTILIRPGVYHEKLVIPASKINVSLIGQHGAVISYDDYASKKNIFGEKMGTSGSSSCYIYSPDFYAENITFENTSGPVGQAVACFISADRVYFKHCRFLGFQDTLYTYGKGVRQYFEECYIEGTVDFIFGWSTAVFLRCNIHSKGNGYVTAPSTDQGQRYGYVFYDCKLTADDNAQKVYLSRPWRPYAQAVFLRCEMGQHILPEGWNDWGKPNVEETTFYAEYHSTGKGANPKARAFFSHQLESMKGYSLDEVLSGTDNWCPHRHGNELLIITR